MRPLGRYQLRIRTLLLIPLVVVFSWWLAIWPSSGSHSGTWPHSTDTKKPIMVIAREPMTEYIDERIHYPNRRHTYVYRALSEAELKAERQAREQAAAHTYAWS